MSREHRLRAARKIAPGALRRSEAGETLNCLLLAPFPDWVALDLTTGALLRADHQSSVQAAIVHEPLALESHDSGSSGHPRPLAAAGPLSPIVVTLEQLPGSWDPARPEAVAVRDVVLGPPLRRRSVKRLLSQLAEAPPERGLLGTVGPSLAYSDLRGTRPSVQVVAPAGGRAWLATDDSASAVHFRLGGREHALPVGSAAQAWARRREVPGRRGRHARGRAPGEIEGPVLLTIGLDRPREGQVRKVVLGIVKEP